MSSILWRCRRLYIDTAVDIQVVRGRWWSPFYEEFVCVPEARDVRVTVAAILKEKLTSKSSDVVDAAVWNPRHQADAGADEFRECERSV